MKLHNICAGGTAISSLFIIYTFGSLTIIDVLTCRSSLREASLLIASCKFVHRMTHLVLIVLCSTKIYFLSFLSDFPLHFFIGKLHRGKI